MKKNLPIIANAPLLDPNSRLNFKFDTFKYMHWIFEKSALSDLIAQGLIASAANLALKRLPADYPSTHSSDSHPSTLIESLGEDKPPAYNLGNDKVQIRKQVFSTLDGMEIPYSSDFTYWRIHDWIENKNVRDQASLLKDLEKVSMPDYNDLPIHIQDDELCRNENLYLNSIQDSEDLSKTFYQALPGLKNGKLVSIDYLIFTEEEFKSSDLLPGLSHYIFQSILRELSV